MMSLQYEVSIDAILSYCGKKSTECNERVVKQFNKYKYIYAYIRLLRFTRNDIIGTSWDAAKFKYGSSEK